jgi:hypothetical protein
LSGAQGRGEAVTHASLSAVVATLGLAVSAHAATITIRVADGPGVGFNDPAPFTPMGGNNATTIGQARLNVFNEAARLWGLLLNSSVPIVVSASFAPLTCSTSSGVLGSAGPTWMFHDFPGAPLPGVFYPAALADALHGSDLAGTTGTNTAFGDVDISAQFNSAINGDPKCLGGSRFYYGFDHQLGAHAAQGPFVADLLGVVLHELGHGLGFVSIVDQNGAGITDSSGTALLGVFDQLVYDENANLFWPQMSAAQRAKSQIGSGAGGNAALVWNASHVNAHLGRQTNGVSVNGHVRLYAPAVYEASSSVSHWDTSAKPDLLMEPFYSAHTGNLTDLTVCVLYDLGWTGNHCPDELSAVAQSLTVNSGTTLNVTLSATNTGGGALTYTVSAQPAHGTLGALNGTALTYMPATGYLGADQFSYQVTEAGVSSEAAAVAIDVLAASGSGGGGGSGGGSGGAAPSSGGGGGAIDGWSLAPLLSALLAVFATRGGGRLLRQRAVSRRR